jgi:hypothetical protein
LAPTAGREDLFYLLLKLALRQAILEGEEAGEGMKRRYLPYSTIYFCPVRKCAWEYEQPNLSSVDKSQWDAKGDYLVKLLHDQAAKTEEELTKHLCTHPRWKLPRKYRKEIKRKPRVAK